MHTFFFNNPKVAEIRLSSIGTTKQVYYIVDLEGNHSRKRCSMSTTNQYKHGNKTFFLTFIIVAPPRDGISVAIALRFTGHQADSLMIAPIKIK